jgi:hypothetical protein
VVFPAMMGCNIWVIPIIVVMYGKKSWDYNILYIIYIYTYIISGWWLSPTPLKNDGVRQLE